MKRTSNLKKQPYLNEFISISTTNLYPISTSPVKELFKGKLGFLLMALWVSGSDFELGASTEAGTSRSADLPAPSPSCP